MTAWLIFVGVMIAALAALWFFLSSYEKNSPEYEIKRVIKQIEDKDYIKNILEEMNILDEYEYAWENCYSKKFNTSKNNEIEEYVSNFIQKFNFFVSNT